MTRTGQILLFLGGCTLLACGGDDDDDGIIVADSGPTFDGGDFDAAITGCGDFEEAADATNATLLGGTAEASGITFATGDTKVVCGVIDPAQADEEVGVTDVDAFDFQLEEGAQVRAVLRSDIADEVGVVFLLQQVADDGSAGTVAGGGFADGYALATSQAAGPATYRLVMIAFPGETPPAASIDYQIEVVDRIACEPAAGAADYTEASDGARSRRNDAVSADWGADTVTSLTTATTDNPEATDLTLAAGTSVHLVGTSADRTANDSYRDKDSFALGLGDDVNEIDIRVVWPSGTDIDIDGMVFAPDVADPELGGFTGAFIGPETTEDFTARVTPGGGVWVWAGTYNDDGATDLPTDYDITICPRNFTP